MKCSSPSSIASTINSVIVKNTINSMPTSTHYYNQQQQTEYSYQSNNFHSQRPVNIIVNDTSSHSQLDDRVLYSQNAGIKVEQNFDFDDSFSPSELSSTKSTGSCKNSATSEIDELNTRDLAQRISQELKRYSIPQAIFAQRVLCRFGFKKSI